MAAQLPLLWRAVWCWWCLWKLWKSEGATLNFSISFDSLCNQTRVPLQRHGDLPALIAFSSHDDFSITAPIHLGTATLLFIPAATASSSYLLCSLVSPLGIGLSQGNVVWVANRHHPVAGNFSLFLNQTTGNLELYDGREGSLAWSTNISGARQGPVSMGLIIDASIMMPQPIGSLLITDASTNNTLWASSDHPTDTLASPQLLQSGMFLTSWTSASDPSEGPYRLAMEVGGLALYYNGSPYWMWSLYGRNNTFGITHTCENLSEALINTDGGIFLIDSFVAAPLDTIAADFCTAEVVTQIKFDDYDQQEVIFVSVQPDGSLVGDTLGNPWIRVLNLFSGSDQCNLPNICGPYGICAPSSICVCPSDIDASFPSSFPSNKSQGCPPIRSLTCHNEATLDDSQSQQRLLALTGVDYYSNKYMLPLNLSTEESCKTFCLQNCSCLAAFWHVHTSSCFHVDQMSSLQGSLNSSYRAFLKVEQPPPANSRRGLIAGLVSGIAALLIGLCIVAGFIYRKLVLRSPADSEEEELFTSSLPGLPTRYTYTKLESITNGFSDQIGKGGFGSVYTGVLQDGTKVAVKRLESLKQGRKEFRVELVILGAIHHYNLVTLLGFCAEGSHRLLVYEFMAKGSLDQWLFNKEAPLEWQHRLNIALGSARGLAYLHGECKDTIIHLDIKPQNILLDEDFVAKVSDFGLSTLMGRETTHVITTMRGTPGYLAPEWLSEGTEISAKCDVFSFGKLLMEILGGRRNFDALLESEKVYFPSWLYSSHMKHQQLNVCEIARVETQNELRQAKLMMNTAFLCVLEDPAQRPPMERVVHMLEGHIPELEQLELSDLAQGLHFCLRTPLPRSVPTRDDDAQLSGAHSSLSASGGVVSFAVVSAR